MIFFEIIFLLMCISLVMTQSNSSYGFDVEHFPGEECFRPCSDSKPRMCYFKWNLEYYTAMGLVCGTCGEPGGLDEDCFKEQCVTADGVERGVMTINRQIPGPPIHVCKGDLIVVDVVNMMGGTAASIHWHGFHQRKTPHFDGVPFVTQCPIDYATTFRYAFWASEPGTQFYHSHSGHHKINGQYGGIVVRQNPKDDPNSNTYDVDAKENLIVLSDWMENLAEAFDPGLPSHPFGQAAKTFLINGKGQFTDPKTDITTRSPLALFRVAKGKRHRFRLVNSMSLLCPAELTIENHVLTIIASDSYNLQPINVTSIVSLPGERYDFVINADKTGDTFWIKVRGLGTCIPRKVQQLAVLSYKPTKKTKMQLSFMSSKALNFSQKFFADEIFLNNPYKKCNLEDPKNFCVSDLPSFTKAPHITDLEADVQLIIGFENYGRHVQLKFPKDYSHFTNPLKESVTVGVINNISMTLPPISLLTQTSDIDESIFCNETSFPARCKGKDVCHCVHRLKVKLNSIVELVIVDTSAKVGLANHPFHLHGFSFYVINIGQNSDKLANFTTVDQQEHLIGRAGRRFPIKDTISIPSKGFAVLRFKADNPGFWLFHCHLDFHISNGMGLILQVGEHQQMVKPPTGFPKCNNFVPKIDASIFNT